MLKTIKKVFILYTLFLLLLLQLTSNLQASETVFYTIHNTENPIEVNISVSPQIIKKTKKVKYLQWDFGDKQQILLDRKLFQKRFILRHFYQRFGEYLFQLNLLDKNKKLLRTINKKIILNPGEMPIADFQYEYNNKTKSTFFAAKEDPKKKDLKFFWSFDHRQRKYFFDDALISSNSPLRKSQTNYLYAKNGNYNGILLVQDKNQRMNYMLFEANKTKAGLRIKKLSFNMSLNSTLLQPQKKLTLKTLRKKNKKLFWSNGKTGNKSEYRFTTKGQQSIVLTEVTKDKKVNEYKYFAQVPMESPKKIYFFSQSNSSNPYEIYFFAFAHNKLTAKNIWWNYGDGTIKRYSNLFALNSRHIYKKKGKYKIKLIIEDIHGNLLQREKKIYIKKNKVKKEKFHELISILAPKYTRIGNTLITLNCLTKNCSNKKLFIKCNKDSDYTKIQLHRRAQHNCQFKKIGPKKIIFRWDDKNGFSHFQEHFVSFIKQKPKENKLNMNILSETENKIHLKFDIPNTNPQLKYFWLFADQSNFSIKYEGKKIYKSLTKEQIGSINYLFSQDKNKNTLITRFQIKEKKGSKPTNNYILLTNKKIDINNKKISKKDLLPTRNIYKNYNTTIDKSFLLNPDSWRSNWHPTDKMNVYINPTNAKLEVSSNGTIILTSFAKSDYQDYLVIEHIKLRKNSTRDLIHIFLKNDKINLKPNLKDDKIEINEDQSIAFHPLKNDFDPEKDELFLVKTSKPTLGNINLNGGNQLIYTAKKDIVGEETIHYTVKDSYGNEETASIRVSILAVPDIQIHSHQDQQKLYKAKQKLNFTIDETPVKLWLNGSKILAEQKIIKEILLKPGKNTIRIKAENKIGNISSKKIELFYEKVPKPIKIY